MNRMDGFHNNPVLGLRKDKGHKPYPERHDPKRQTPEGPALVNTHTDL